VDTAAGDGSPESKKTVQDTRTHLLLGLGEARRRNVLHLVLRIRLGRALFAVPRGCSVRIDGRAPASATLVDGAARLGLVGPIGLPLLLAGLSARNGALRVPYLAPGGSSARHCDVDVNERADTIDFDHQK